MLQQFILTINTIESQPFVSFDLITVGNILESTSADQLDEDSVGFSPEELELQKQMLEVSFEHLIDPY